MTGTRSVAELGDKYLLQIYKRSPLVMARGEGVYLYDEAGNQYLDALAGIAVNGLGYGHPEVVQAIKEAAEGLLHTSNLFHTRPAAALAEQLVERSQFAERVYFGNSGSEVVEAALKFARRRAKAQGRPEQTGLVAFEHSFHGRTFGALSVTSKAKYREPFEPLVPGVRFVPHNDVAAAVAAIDAGVCGVIVEPVQGEGGVRPSSAEFLRALRARCDEVGAALIFDEIQCGLGRTGELWSHTHSGIEPDMLTLAKPLGGGLPIGALLVGPKVAATIGYGEHGSTFGGNPLVCTVASKVLELLSDESFLAHVREVGGYMGERLGRLAGEIDEVSEVRGRGLMWGLQLREPIAGRLMGACLQQRLLLASAGDDDVVRMVPPLVFERAHVDELCEKLAAAFDTL
jgi:acetylornithine/N-succinyldiaminopimelate aminotransferase